MPQLDELKEAVRLAHLEMASMQALYFRDHDEHRESRNNLVEYLAEQIRNGATPQEVEKTAQVDMLLVVDAIKKSGVF